MHYTCKPQFNHRLVWACHRSHSDDTCLHALFVYSYPGAALVLAARTFIRKKNKTVPKQGARWYIKRSFEAEEAPLFAHGDTGTRALRALPSPGNTYASCLSPGTKHNQRAQQVSLSRAAMGPWCRCRRCHHGFFSFCCFWSKAPLCAGGLQRGRARNPR